MRWLLLVSLVACHPAEPKPPPPSCEDAAVHVQGLQPPGSKRAKQTHDVIAIRCAQDNWPVDVRACLMHKTSLTDPNHCKSHLTITQRRAFESQLASIDQPPPPPSSKLPPSCERYRLAIERLVACDKLPKETRDALRESYDQTSAAWADLPDEAREALETACASAADAVDQSAAACQP